MNGNSKNDTYHSWFDSGRKSLWKINTTYLVKTLGDQSGFIPINGAIFMLLQFLNPFVANNLLMSRPWNQAPSFVGQQSVNLLVHGLAPQSRGNSLGVTRGFGGKKNTVKGVKRAFGGVEKFEVRKGFGFKRTHLGSGEHTSGRERG